MLKFCAAVGALRLHNHLLNYLSGISQTHAHYLFLHQSLLSPILILIFIAVRYIRHIIFVPALLAIIALISIATSGCKNKCGSTTCQNGGACESNVCVCPFGYSGNSCQNSWSNAVIGTYNCSNANCTPAITSAATWQSVITADATNGGYTVDITNFDGNNTTVIATVDSSEHGISMVTITNSTGVNATGNYDSTTQKMNLDFSAYINGSTGYRCNMIMTKIQ